MFSLQALLSPQKTEMGKPSRLDTSIWEHSRDLNSSHCLLSHLTFLPLHDNASLERRNQTTSPFLIISSQTVPCIRADFITCRLLLLEVLFKEQAYGEERIQHDLPELLGDECSTALTRRRSSLPPTSKLSQACLRSLLHTSPHFQLLYSIC